MLIVDAQVHLWPPNTPERPWPARAAPHREPLGKDELLGEMDRAGVNRVVIVPPSWEGDRNDFALAAAQAHPDRFAVMGRFDPDAPGAREMLPAWKGQPGMLGMRFTFHTELLRQPLLDGRFDWVWGAAERAGIPLMVLAHHAYAHLIDAVAARYPGLRLVMDHLGLDSTRKDETAFQDLDKLLALAQRPNIAVKASAMPCYTTDPWPCRRLHPYLRRVYDAFGPRRMFWAPTGRAYRAPTARASRCSPRRSPGSPPRTRTGSWAAAFANGWDGRCDLTAGGVRLRSFVAHDASLE